MTLIEADTDGVYFTVPEEFDEEQERTVVAAVATELPAGIRLEYETRLRSFLSHEVKNYAAITYAGQLIVRGAALRSSRTEPYGDRFLRQALLCVMTGDVVGVRDAFLKTVQALRTRSLPASDLATRVRLSKTPKEYMAVRQRHQEPQYEALLSAGRTSWEPGERVRFYRSRTGAFVWLPDEEEEASAALDPEDEVEELGTPLPYAAAHIHRETMDNARDYDVEYYLQQLVGSYAARLRKAFAPEDYAQVFRLDGQAGLFDRPVETIQPRWNSLHARPIQEEGVMFRVQDFPSPQAGCSCFPHQTAQRMREGPANRRPSTSGQPCTTHLRRVGQASILVLLCSVLLAFPVYAPVVM